MNVAQFLKDSANAVQAATLIKRTVVDVVRQVPLAAMGTAAIVGLLAGILFSRRGRAS